MKYNWQQGGWPRFEYDLSAVEDMLLAFAEETGHMTGVLNALPPDLETESLGLDSRPETVRDARARGAAELMRSVREGYASALSKEDLFAWHHLIFAGREGVLVGTWRTHAEPMQVVSGPVGKEKIHFEAPPSALVPRMMEQFIEWFNATAPGGARSIKQAPVRSAIAHLYFESIHPFEDGNGRIGRAIAEKALSQTLGRPVMLSLSRSIEADRKKYYSAFAIAQGGNEVTAWLEYFVGTLLHAQIEARHQVEFTLRKTRFFDTYRPALNDRQLKVLRRMLEEGPDGFKGGMTAHKYCSITGTSKPTATRDLQDLAEKGALVSQGGGRSTHYLVNLQV
jgi:Fic family protein